MRLTRSLFQRRRLAAAVAAALAAGGTAAVAMVPAQAATAGCAVAYTVSSQWPGGFTGNLTITNLGAATTSWTLTFDFPAAGQAVTQGWSANWSQSGQHVTATSLSWNAVIGTNASTQIGFNGAWTASNPVPTAFSLNGVACDGGTTGSPTPSPTSASPTPTGSASPTPTSPSPTPSSSTPSPTHVDNPYAGADGYRNPDYVSEVQTAAQAKGGTLGAKMAQVANYSTAVWLDRIATIAGGTGVTRTLRGHLDAALAQQTSSGHQVVATFVIYDLPNRDCSALASNGELLIANNGLNIYKTQYIDPIAAIFADPKYANLRISTVVEPDSLPNLITNLSFAKCAEANSTGAYLQGVAYAVGKLHAIGNVYTYIDVAHSGWLGWDSNFGPFVNLLGTLAGQTPGGFGAFDGFVSDTANTTPTTEPYLTANQQISGQPVRSATFYQWNQYIDELSYATAMRTALIAKGYPSTIGMMIDTSRNGWGGTARPTGPSTSTDLNTFVNASRIDRRPHRGDWCNQNGAGLGYRPQANPAPGFDAYIWVKPPGESDGSSQPIPNDEGKGFDPMCDPTYGGNALNGYSPTNALPNAPISGAWFEAQFEQLVQNAYPAIP